MHPCPVFAQQDHGLDGVEKMKEWLLPPFQRLAMYRKICEQLITLVHIRHFLNVMNNGKWLFFELKLALGLLEIRLVHCGHSVHLPFV